MVLPIFLEVLQAVQEAAVGVGAYRILNPDVSGVVKVYLVVFDLQECLQDFYGIQEHLLGCV
jgi:hypothetical protein